MIRVLVVDDSKFMAKALNSVLVAMDFDVVATAHDGLEALTLYAKHLPDLMLLDITMPNMDGVECLQRAIADFPDARIVMLSAIKDPEVVDHCLRLGAKGFLEKPIRSTSPSDLRRLSDAIDEAVAKAV